MDAASELREFYRKYDLAVERLPQRLKGMVALTRCEERHGSITFKDASGAALCTVDAEGRVILPSAPAPNAGGSAAEGVTRQQYLEVAQLAHRLNDQLRALDEALAEFVPNIAERVRRLEDDQARGKK